jgi:hypothetical protein
MTNMNQRVLFIALIAGLLLGCQSAPERRFNLKGKVIAVDRAQRQVRIARLYKGNQWSAAQILADLR